MLLDIIFIVVGLAALAFAGDKLVDYAAATARKARVTPTVIGLTVIALGTSLPEAFVSITAAIQSITQNRPELVDISIANVVGSNIANIALILGFVAIFVAIPVTKGVMKFDYPIVVIASASMWLVLWNGVLDRWEGGVYVVVMLIYLTVTVIKGRREHKVDEEETLSEEMKELAERSVFRLLVGLALSLAALGVGARILVDGASGIAEAIGISQRVIGLTVVAFGTSLPELVASIAAAWKNQHEMAVANVMGSNLFNMLFVLGVTALIRDLPVNEQTMKLDLWVMSGVTILLFPLLLRGRRLTRFEGILLTAIYLTYTVYLFFA